MPRITALVCPADPQPKGTLVMNWIVTGIVAYMTLIFVILGVIAEGTRGEDD